jgi:hypothetical protein
MRAQAVHAAAVAAWLLSATLAFCPHPARAQSCHPLDGVWILQPDRSSHATHLSFNPHFAITAVRLAIRSEGERITQQWQFRGPHLDRTTRYAFRVDGTRRDTGLADPMDFEYAAIAAEWQNCTLVQTGFSHLFGLEVVMTSSYIVSPDGSALTIVQFGESPISIVDRRLVFRKES